MIAYGFGISLLVNLLAIPVIRWVGVRIGKVSMPRQDRWHRKPTPSLGGVGIFLATAAGLLGLALLGELPPVHWSLVLAPTLMFFLGMVDDFKRLSPPVKLTGQLVASAMVIYFSGLTIRFFPWPVANLLLTLFWLIGITNAINLLDNMDGIAGGVSLIAAGFLGFGFWQAGTMFPLALALCLGGSLLGFLVYNFPPAKIFMGDSGSMFLGFTLAMLAILRSSQASNVFAVLAVPLLVFLAPILDTFLVTITRLLRGLSPVQGGTDHTTHRLVSFGLDGRQVAMILYAVSFVGGFAGMVLERRDYTSSLALVPVVLVFLSLFTAYLARIKVVTSHKPQPARALTRLAIDLTFRRQVFEILLDLVLVGFSYYLAYWTLGGLDLSREGLVLFSSSWPLVLLAAYLSMRLAGVYRTAWGFLETMDFLRFSLASVMAGAVGYLLVLSILREVSFSLAVFVLFSLFLFVSIAGTRASFKVTDRLLNRMKLIQNSDGVLVIGAGEPGEMVLRWLEKGIAGLNGNPLRAIGIVESDPSFTNRSLRQVQVLGAMDRLKDIVLDKKPVGLIVSAPESLNPDQLQLIMDAGQSNQIWVRVLRMSLEDLGEQTY